MTTQSLASLSDTLAYFAVVGYLVAAALFAAEFAYGARWAGRAGLAVAVAGFAANVACAVTRGLAAHRVPWANMYEVSVMVGILTVAAYLVWVRRRPEVRPLGVFFLLPAVLGIAVGRILLYAPAGPLVPALQSNWIKIHVVAAMVGSSLLCVASVFSILFLIKEHFEAKERPPLVAGGAATVESEEVRQAMAGYLDRPAEPGGQARKAGPWWDRLPPSRVLDDLAYKTTALAFPIWTFAIIAGAIWAESAWSRYWGWDPKETWSFITWVIFAAYLHARATAGWRGRRAAVIGVLGLVSLLVTFYAVNLWIVGLHSYAGVS